MSKCPGCGADGAYVGYNVVECRHPDCDHYCEGAVEERECQDPTRGGCSTSSSCCSTPQGTCDGCSVDDLDEAWSQFSSVRTPAGRLEMVSELHAEGLASGTALPRLLVIDEEVHKMNQSIARLIRKIRFDMEAFGTSRLLVPEDDS